MIDSWPITAAERRRLSRFEWAIRRHVRAFLYRTRLLFVPRTHPLLACELFMAFNEAQTLASNLHVRYLRAYHTYLRELETVRFSVLFSTYIIEVPLLDCK